MFAIVLLLGLVGLGAEANPLEGTTYPSNVSVPIEPKIVGGRPTSIESFPYQVSLRLKERDKYFGQGHNCGASVISQRLLATAAHCIFNEEINQFRKAREFTVVMGTSYLNKKDRNTLQYNVQQIINHPYYNHRQLLNDISLIFINGYIPWKWPTVKAIPLQSRPVRTGQMCQVTGWGRTSSNGNVALQLRVASIPLVDQNVCRMSYAQLTNGMFCAGYMATGGVDACQGDSGGPLACDGELTGIVSWGFDCGLPAFPGVYTNVSMYRSWIISQNSSLNYTHYSNGAFNPKRVSTLYHGALLALIFILSYFTSNKLINL